MIQSSIRDLNPGKIVCLARTFAKHAAELGNEVPTDPIFFLKAPSALIGPGDAIILPEQSALVQHEGEIAVRLSASLTRASEAQAYNAIGGWSVLNDVTARDLQRADAGRFTRAKNFDSFCPLHPEFVDIADWRQVAVRTVVNGVQRQYGALSTMVFTPGRLLAYVSHFMTLEAGDIVSLGTPHGVDKLSDGDLVGIELVNLEGHCLRRLENPVRVA